MRLCDVSTAENRKVWVCVHAAKNYIFEFLLHRSFLTNVFYKNSYNTCAIINMTTVISKHFGTSIFMESFA